MGRLDELNERGAEMLADSYRKLASARKLLKDTEEATKGLVPAVPESQQHC